MNKAAFEEFTHSISRLLPTGVDTLKEDFERNLRAALQTALQKMDLVNREDFEIQAQLLASTCEKLEKLEARLAELEAAATEPTEHNH